MKPRVIIYCDGACSPNPGAGGWGAVLIGPDVPEGRRELSGAVPGTTSNRMELLGAIMALRALERPSDVAIHTDSLYVHNAFKKGWIARWRENGWRTAARKPVENQDLRRALIELTEVHRMDWNWVRGHADDPENNRCDALAVAARVRLAGQTG